MQRDYEDKGVRVLGLASLDTLEAVEAFMEEWAPKMEYTVAFDDDEKSQKSFMEAAGQRGIPSSFVIDKGGRIAWIGHPMGGLDDVVARLVAGSYDIEVARKVHRIETKWQEAWREKDFDTVLGYLDELVALEPGNASHWATKVRALTLAKREDAEVERCVGSAVAKLEGDPVQLARFANASLFHGPASAHVGLASAGLAAGFESAPGEAEVGMAYFCSLAAEGKGDEALEAASVAIGNLRDDADALARFARTLGERKGHAGCVDLALRTADRVIELEPGSTESHLLKFEILNVARGDVQAASEVGRKIVEIAREDAQFLNNFAWDLLTGEATQGKYAPLALLASEAMYALEDGKSHFQIDTLALAKFENGLVDEAIELQLAAIEGTSNERERAEYSERLERYRRAKGASHEPSGESPR